MSSTSYDSWSSPLKVIGIALLALVCFVAYTLQRVVRHPLNRFPGPLSAKFSSFHHCQRFLGGRQPFEVLELHKKYGPIVRTAPNDLSFVSSQAWRDVYAQRKGHLPFVKSQFYDGGNFAAESLSIVSERDPQKHSHMRKYLSSAFSDRSLKEQEYLITEIVDDLLAKLDGFCDSKQETNMTTWYNLATFDIIGSLAFGESFGGIASGEEHPWISTVIKSLRKGALGDCMKRFPVVAKIAMAILSKQIDEMLSGTRKHENNSRMLIERRIARKTDRKDFMTNILQARDYTDIPDTQIAAHTSDFVIAGSETTATALACATYFLCQDSAIVLKLRKELDGVFSSCDQINGASTANLEYLTAVCREAMRMYPPLPFTLSRVVPKGGDIVDGQLLPEGTVVSCAPLASSLMPTNFHEPNKFKPERWLDKTGRDDFEASQPFSLGPRGCMGKSMGWLEMRTILAKVYLKYELELVDEDLDWMGSSRMHTLWKKPDLKVRVSKRVH